MLFSAGYTLKNKKLPYLLLLIGAILIFVSLTLSFFITYRINTGKSIRREFRTLESSKTYIIKISKEVTSVDYDLTLNTTAQVGVTAELIGNNGLILDSEQKTITQTGNLSKRVTVDDFLDHIVLSINNNNTKEVSGKIKVRYTENLGSSLYIVLIAAFTGISGSIITAFGLLLCLMRKYL